MENKFLEPYAKENNILQLSLFYFGRPRPKKTEIVWQDKDGSYKIECYCDYGVPGSFEQDCYTACMRIWVRQGMPKKGISVTYANIAHELDLSSPRSWSSKIKKALQVIGLARYKFTQSFISVADGVPKRINTYFSLFDTASLYSYKKQDKQRGRESQLIFPQEIRRNLECKYYQLLDMAWYRALPEGLPRRLYEYLAKRRYHNIGGDFIIAEELLCRWLPIKDNNVTTRRKTLKKIAEALIDAGYLRAYYFNRPKKQWIFSYAQASIPPKQKTAAELAEQVPVDQRHGQQIQSVFLEALNWVATIPYFRKRRKQKLFALPMEQIVRRYPGIRHDYERLAEKGSLPKASWIYQRFMEEPRRTETSAISSAAIPESLRTVDNAKADAKENDREGMDDLLDLVRMHQKNISDKLLRTIAAYYQERGYDYVRWNILYSNQKANKNYSIYLQKALAGNWAEEWQEQERKQSERIMQHREKQEKESREIRRKEKEINKAQSQKPDFYNCVEKLDYNIKQQLWVQAEKDIPASNIRREMNVKIKYAENLLTYFIDQGKNFSHAIFGKLEFSFVNKIADDLFMQRAEDADENT